MRRKNQLNRTRFLKALARDEGKQPKIQRNLGEKNAGDERKLRHFHAKHEGRPVQREKNPELKERGNSVRVSE